MGDINANLHKILFRTVLKQNLTQDNYCRFCLNELRKITTIFLIAILEDPPYMMSFQNYGEIDFCFLAQTHKMPPKKIMHIYASMVNFFPGNTNTRGEMSLLGS
jgi:hypothetical protein